MTENITTCPDKEALVTYLYEEDDGPGRRAIEGHVEQCAACREEISSFRRVRDHLAGWEAPVADVPLPAFGPALPGVGAARLRSVAWSWITQPAFVAAAAAVLVMGLAAGLANLEIRLGSDGLVIRTGWARASQPAPATASTEHAAATPTRVETTTPPGLPNGAPGLSNGAPGLQARGLAPWRADLAALEQQLRQEFQPGRAAATLSPAGARTARGLDPETLRQIQALIDESEVRQQRNLALRMAEVSRDFDLQRKADLVQIQQGLGRLEGRTDAEAARTRELVNYMMRVSQQQPPR